MLRHIGLTTMVVAAFVACAVSTAEAYAKPAQKDPIRIKNAKVVASGGGAPGAAYMTIINGTDKADKLVSAKSTPKSHVMIHETVEEDGVVKMRHRKSFDLPASGKLVLKPGGRHLMLMGLGPEVKPGTKITLELLFENAKPVKVTLPVLSPAEAHAQGSKAK